MVKVIQIDQTCFRTLPRSPMWLQIIQCQTVSRKCSLVSMGNISDKKVEGLPQPQVSAPTLSSRSARGRLLTRHKVASEVANGVLLEVLGGSLSMGFLGLPWVGGQTISRCSRDPRFCWCSPGEVSPHHSPVLEAGTAG